MQNGSDFKTHKSDTESCKALNALSQKLKQEPAPALKYLHAIQEITDIYPDNSPLNSLLNKIHQGISTMLLTKED